MKEAESALVRASNMETAQRPLYVGTIDVLDREIWRRYFTRQFSVLIDRHCPEDAIFHRVVADYCQHPVRLANQGRLEDACRALRTLDGLVTTTDAELVAVHRVAALPAWALIHWRKQDNDGALALLAQALDACLELTVRFGHDYLTAKRLHLVANTARVLFSQRLPGQASARVTALRAVAGGAREAWPFTGADSLDVPLQGPERSGIEHQLKRLGCLTG
jgi:hypothetical protein